MKKQRLFSMCGTALLTLLVTQSLSAHHNFAAHYRTDANVTITGIVTEFRFVNPHARVYLDVRNENGEIEKWMAEGDASVALRRSGWVADELKPGDLLKVEGYPSRSGENMLGWNNITLADGTEIGGGDGRLLEKLRILEESLARYRQQRGS
ncbi:MAG: hypothetical protein HOM55_08725 [Proteobacteria bacterium]|jgi:hypothetical protein|nr:hypothetical protein [Pseudomonadota bacterium]